MNSDALESFKATIWKNVNSEGDTPISFVKAKQAISDYKKATGDMDGVAELMVYYWANVSKQPPLHHLYISFTSPLPG